MAQRFFAGLGALALVLGIALVGCGGGGEDPEVAAVESAAANVVAAIRDGTPDEVRELMSEEQRESTSLEELEPLRDCLPAAVQVSFEVDDEEIEAGRATVSVRYAVSQGGSNIEVGDRWEFARQEDGRWRLASVPACPL